MKKYDYEFYKKSADYILQQIPQQPEIALILGSSLGSLADELEEKIVIDYKDVPNYLVSTVSSHASQFIFGKLSGKYVVAMSGRFHYYEGYEFEQLAAPIRVLKLLGVKKTILTNAAGAVNKEFQIGDIMVIEDHIKLFGASPMRGPNVEEFGERFFDTTKMYTPQLRELAFQCAADLGQQDRMRQGVYYFYSGPQFETPAEIRMIRGFGGDAVGMSTVTEALTAAHCGMELLGLSLMTNMAAGVLDMPVSGDEVTVAANEAAERFKCLLRELIKRM